MDAVENAVHGIVSALSSWLPGGGSSSDAPGLAMSRELWMPDQSCRVCYECESQFTIFNRRHHCRVCGRVFCGKCTLYTIPVLSSPEGVEEDGDRIRVCNFCFKLRQQLDRGDSTSEQVTSPGLTPVSSGSSFFSSSNASMASPRSQSTASGNFSRDNRVTENSREYRDMSMRSDEEDEGKRDFVDTSLRAESIPDEKGYASGDSKLSDRSFSRKSCDEMEGLEDESNFPRHLYEPAYRDVEKSVDFENNMLVWFPPPPEDDEEDTGPAYDDDDEDDEGGWGLPRSSGSMSSSEYRTRERAASEEHRKAMRAVVDGHFKALVAQLLKQENIPVEDEDEKDSWLEILTSLALQAANIVKPDRGGSMDPGGYVKVKCIASGRRSESMIIRGIVCKKNVAHKRMPSRFKNPRLLILGGALEYHRVPNLLSSMDTLLQQEKDYLNMAAARIEAHHPNVVIVEKGVSGFAQERLLQKEISLVLNVKRPLLERVARCTGAQIISSPDNLLTPKTGHCELFHTEKFVEEHGSAGQGGKQLSKTLMFFEGCPKPLGCTALLRGANGDDLKRIKRVLQLAIFASYHLSLETSFLADEGASLPDHRSPIVVTLPSKQTSSDRSITSIPGLAVPAVVSTDNRGPFFPGASSNDHLTNALSAAIAGHSSEGGRLQRYGFNFNGFTGNWPSSFVDHGLSSSLRRAFGEEVFGADGSNDGHWGKDDEGEAKRSHEDGLEETDADADDQSRKDDFPPTPSDHQSILVSVSSRCLTKGSVCERPNILRIKFYGNSDKPLGRFLRDSLFNLNNRCQHCEETPDAHISCYTHRLGSLTISVRRMDDHTLPGAREGKIWMWHRCLKCPRENDIPPVTRRIVMSDAAWGLSFGKFLELSFSNHTAASRVAACGHQLHRDCLRFYGFGNMLACFRYAPVHLHSIHLPPSKLEFNGATQREWLRNEAKEVANKVELVFTEILNTILVIGEHIASSGSFSGSAESRKRVVLLEAMFKRDKAEFEAALLKAAPLLKSDPEPGQPLPDVFELSRLRKELAIRAIAWERRLNFFVSTQPKKFTGSDPGFLAEHLKDFKTNLLKLSNTEAAVNAQQTSPVVNDTEGEKTAIPQDDYASCNIDAIAESVSCLPTVMEGTTESLNIEDPDMRRTLSEGSCPVLADITADISHKLEAAWSGQSQVVNMPSSKKLVGTDTESTKDDGENESSNELDSKSDQATLKTSSQTEDEELFSLQQQQELDGLGHWIDGPYSTLYSAKGIQIQSGSASSITCHAGQEALQGGARLFLSEGINNTVTAVYEDEPTSIIAHALLSQHYTTEVSGKQQNGEKEGGSVLLPELVSLHSQQLEDGRKVDSKDASSSGRPSDDPLLNSKGVNIKIENGESGVDAKLKYVVTAYYAKHFDALRKKCCSGDLEYVRSLSRCRKWGAQGGKSNVFFAKTMDDRFIIKQVTRTELLSFLEFAPEYFRYLSESLNSGSPTCLAKILGMYQVIIKQAKGGKEVARMDLMVMENLLYSRHVTRLYDLKGSVRSRYNSDSSGKNTVLLDQNLLEAMPTAPIFVGNKAKRLLERAVWNDTAFLANIDVMDYSLLVGIDEERGELVLGIIDFMRQYTWDKHLETWVKASGILGGPKNAPPTVISPKQYKKRFRKAMSTYFVTVPDQWTPPPSVISAHSDESSANPHEDFPAES